MHPFRNQLPLRQVRILGIHRTVIDPSWRYNLRSPFWRLYLNPDPGAWVDHPGGRHLLAPTAVHVLPSWGNYQSGCDRPVRHLFIHFDPVDLDHWARLQVPAPVALPDIDLAARLEREWTAPWASHLAQAVVQMALVQLVSGLSSRQLEDLRHYWDRPHPLAPALALIEERLTSPPDIPSLAACCHLSPDHFTRLFRQRLGRTPSRYIAERRIAQAASQLLDGVSSIDTVATAHGFANRYHFTRVFTRVMQQGPAAYRRNLLLPADDVAGTDRQTDPQRY